MKKALAILMALTMLFAVCVPVFAANPIVETGEQTGQGEIKVLGSSATENYTVTFPATTDIVWGQNAALDYQVRCQLKAENRLKVSVAPVSDPTNAAAFLGSTDQQNKIMYTLGGDMAITTATNNIPTDEAHNLTVTVAADEWTKAPLKDYNDHLTFSVEVVPAV